MIIQLVIIVILILLFFFKKTTDNLYNNDEIRKKFILTACILMIIQSGLRHYGVGPDTYTYYKYFEITKSTTWSQIFYDLTNFSKYSGRRDPGYSFIVKNFQIFSSNYTIYLLFIAIIFYYSFGAFLYRNTRKLRDVLLGITIYQALFVVYLPNSSIRQSIAISIFLLGFEFIKKQKIWYFIFIIILASLIHRSVLIVLPLYFIAYNKNLKTTYILALLMFPFAIIFKSKIAYYLLSYAGSDYYMSYASTFRYASTPIIFTALILFIYIYSLFHIKKTLKYYPDSVIYFNALSMALLFTSLVWVNPTLMRIVTYFSFFLIVLLPSVFNSSTYRIRNLLYLSSIGLLLVFIVIQNYQYKFLWQEMKIMFDF